MTRPFSKHWTGWLCSLPTTVATLVTMVAAGLLSAGSLLAVHRLIPHHLRSLHNDIAGFVLAIVGVIYAVLLAFIAIAVWENYTAADNLVQTEANLVGDLYRATISLPDDVARGLRRDLFAYTEAVVKTEWPELAGGKVMQHAGWLALDDVHLKLAALHQEDQGTLAAQTSMLRMLNQLYDVRRGRFHAAAASLPQILWWNLLAVARSWSSSAAFSGAPTCHARSHGRAAGCIDRPCADADRAARQPLQGPQPRLRRTLRLAVESGRDDGLSRLHGAGDARAIDRRTDQGLCSASRARHSTIGHAARRYA